MWLGQGSLWFVREEYNRRNRQPARGSRRIAVRLTERTSFVLMVVLLLLSLLTTVIPGMVERIAHTVVQAPVYDVAGRCLHLSGAEVAALAAVRAWILPIGSGVSLLVALGTCAVLLGPAGMLRFVGWWLYRAGVLTWLTLLLTTVMGMLLSTDAAITALTFSMLMLLDIASVVVLRNRPNDK